MSPFTSITFFYDRFEANEGQSISDTLVSICKCAFNRALLKNDGVASLSDIVDLIKSEMIEVLEFGSTHRKSARDELIIPLISKKHSLVLIGDKVIYNTCTDCTVFQLCNSCMSENGINKS